MGSMFSAPKVNTPKTRRAINDARHAANDASNNINQTANQAGNSLTQLGGNLNRYLTPVNVNAGGLSSSYNNGTVSVVADPARQALINQLYGAYNDASVAFGDLRNQWTPGESALRAAQLQQLENARLANASNLRENLAKRGVLGSSFAQDAFTRANLENTQQKNSVIANTYLQELDAQHQLIGDQYTAAANAASAKINELNLEGNVGLQLSSQAQDLMKQAATLQAQLASQGAQLRVQGALGAGGIYSNGITNAAQLTSNLAAQQAQLDAQAQSGAGSLLGTLAGFALMPFGGTSLLGSALGLGGASAAAAPAAPAAAASSGGLFGGVSPYYLAPGGGSALTSSPYMDVNGNIY